MRNDAASAGRGAEDLALLIRSRYALIAVDTFEEERLLGLVERVATGLGIPVFTWSRTRGLSRSGTAGAVYDTAEPDKVLRHLEVADTDGIFVLADFQPYLDDPLVVRRLRETARAFTGDRRTILLTGTAIELPAELRRHSVPFRFQLPSEPELREELRRTLGELQRGGLVEVNLAPPDADRLVDNLRGLTLAEVRRALHRLLLEDGRLDADDVGRALAIKQESIGSGGLLEFHPPAAGVPLGGMQNVRTWLQKRRAAFTSEAREFGLEPPKGILVLGVQGCGKSLLARSVSAAWQLPLVRLDPGPLYDKFIGETEKNLRRALGTVEAMAPAVLWIDEIEKGFASGGEDGGVSQRVLGSFLTWFQEHRAGVFVVATANAIEELAPELLRKGRFDEIFFVDLPTAEERAQILALHLGRRERDPRSFDVAALAEASDGFSGAELEQAVVAGLYTAFHEGRELSSEILWTEIASTVPLSVTMAEKIARLREWARGRAVPAG